jgi:hypothetical protein
MKEKSFSKVPHISNVAFFFFSILGNFSLSTTSEICRGIWLILVTLYVFSYIAFIPYLTFKNRASYI